MLGCTRLCYAVLRFITICYARLGYDWLGFGWARPGWVRQGEEWLESID